MNEWKPFAIPARDQWFEGPGQRRRRVIMAGLVEPGSRFELAHPILQARTGGRELDPAQRFMIRRSPLMLLLLSQTLDVMGCVEPQKALLSLEW